MASWNNRPENPTAGQTHVHNNITYVARDDDGDWVWDVQKSTTCDDSRYTGKYLYDCNVNLRDSCLFWWGEAGQRSLGKDVVRNRIKIFDVEGISSILKTDEVYGYILSTTGKHTGTRVIMNSAMTTPTTGSNPHHGQKIKSRGYDYGYGSDYKTPGFKSLTNEDNHAYLHISYQGTFRWNPSELTTTTVQTVSYTFSPDWMKQCAATHGKYNHTDLFQAVNGTKDHGKGGYSMYVWPRDQLKDIMDEIYAETSKDCYKFNDPIAGDTHDHWIVN